MIFLDKIKEFLFDTPTPFIYKKQQFNMFLISSVEKKISCVKVV